MLTIAVGATLKVRRFLDRLLGAHSRGGTAGYLDLLRHVCTARDRYRLYIEVCRFTAAGGIAICERYPVPQNRGLAGPCIDQYLSGNHTPKFAKALRDLEARYYQGISPPDLLLVLNLDPELAARRKLTEPAEYVRARTRIVWETDWRGARARIIDAARPLPEVVSELKSLIWAEV